MPDDKTQKDDSHEPSQREQPPSPKPLREVVVRHLDEPPPSGKRSIHRRRPAPIVPQKSGGDKSSKK